MRAVRLGSESVFGFAGIRTPNPSWSKMLAKVFKIDVTQCIHCTGTLRPIAAIKDPDEIIRYLKHKGIDYEPPEKAPAK